MKQWSFNTAVLMWFVVFAGCSSTLTVSASVGAKQYAENARGLLYVYTATSFCKPMILSVRYGLMCKLLASPSPRKPSDEVRKFIEDAIATYDPELAKNVTIYICPDDSLGNVLSHESLDGTKTIILNHSTYTALSAALKAKNDRTQITTPGAFSGKTGAQVKSIITSLVVHEAHHLNDHNEFQALAASWAIPVACYYFLKELSHKTFGIAPLVLNYLLYVYIRKQHIKSALRQSVASAHSASANNGTKEQFAEDHLHPFQAYLLHQELELEKKTFLINLPEWARGYLRNLLNPALISAADALSHQMPELDALIAAQQKP